MAFNFNWAPQRIPTKLKGQANLPEIEQPFDFNSYFTNLVNREEMDGYHPAQNFSVPNQQHGGNPAINYAGYSPTTPMTEQDIINQNLAERQAGNANDMANWIQQGGTPQADAVAAAQQQAQQQEAEKQKRIKEIEAEIAEIEQRIAERKRGMAANEDALNTQLAAIEARKINQKDPTSIWRWKAQMDENRRIANAQNKADNTAKANAMIEIANDLDSIIVDDKMTSQDQKAYLSKLSNMKTLGEKAGVPKSVIDSINAKIREVKGENKQVVAEALETDKPEDFEFEGTDREQGEARATRILQKDPEKLTQNEIMTLKRDIQSGKISVSNDTKNKIDQIHSQVIERDKKRVEADQKEERLLKKGMNLSSEDLEFLKGRKGLKHHTDSYGNEWYTRG